MELWRAPEWETLQHPCHPDHLQLLEVIGVSPLAAPAVLEVVKRASTIPYPPHWSEELDLSSGIMYFYHEMQDKSSWQHPLVDTFRDILEVVENAVVDETLGLDAIIGCVEKAMLEARERAMEDLADWVGPLRATGAEGVYFYNQRTGCSEWEDPCQRWRYDLQVRYDLLVGFIDLECEAHILHLMPDDEDGMLMVSPQEPLCAKESFLVPPQQLHTVSDWMRRLSPRTLASFCSAIVLSGGSDIVTQPRSDLGCMV